MNLANAKVGQLLIPVDDFEKGVAFYRDILGLPFLFAAPPQMAFFNCGGVRLLVGVTPPGQKPRRGSAIYFQVPDIHAVFSSLKHDGVRFLAEPRGESNAQMGALVGGVHRPRRKSIGSDERGRAR